MGGSIEIMQNINKENAEFAIIALTGKVRSGTSDIADMLTRKDFPDYATQPSDTSDWSMSEIREHKVVYRFLHHQWHPFVELSVTSVMISFLLELDTAELKNEKILENESLKEMFEDCIKEENFKNAVLERLEEVDSNIQFQKKLSGNSEGFGREKCINILKKIANLNNLKETWNENYENGNLKYTLENFVLCYGVFPHLSDYFREKFGNNLEFTVAFQEYGINIRAYGRALKPNDRKVGIDASKIFVMPERVNQFIKLLRHYRSIIGDGEKRTQSNPVFIVINNLKNIFEAFYFRKRYSAFYLIAVSCDERQRRTLFDTSTQYGLINLNEDLSSGKKVFKAVSKYGLERLEKIDNKLEKDIRNELGLNDAAIEFVKNVFEKHTLRRMCFEQKLGIFILQDVTTCIENADIFLTRDFREKEYLSDYSLTRSLARIVTLILHPGLLTPTKTERCMQIAMTAKLNSGCLSRQVGAVVTDDKYNILSLGWNDAPCGMESCIRRNLFDLFRKHDEEAYSEYELGDEEFRKYLFALQKYLNNDKKKELQGLPMAFCFKDIYQDIIKQRDQIYTRALHAEERALIACKNERTKGGYLFTTSSPCELCAKKIKEAEIKRIYYIEQYPGISRAHIINSGRISERAEYELFVGAVGSAYVKLYAPVMPYKDELTALGYSSVALFSENSKKNNDGFLKKDVKKTDKKVFFDREKAGQVQQKLWEKC